MKLSSLAQLAIDAAGGLDRWRQFETISARLAVGGVLWPLKHQQGHDYDAEVLGGTSAAHYVYRHEEFSGILVPTRRRVLGRGADRTSIPEPVMVSIDLSDVEFS